MDYGTATDAQKQIYNFVYERVVLVLVVTSSKFEFIYMYPSRERFPTTFSDHRSYVGSPSECISMGLSK